MLKSLTPRYVVALSLVAIMSLASHAILVRVLAMHASSASVINISGRQRMLSQRIASLSLQYRMGDPDARVDLLTSLNEFEINFETLTTAAYPRATLAADPALRALYYGGRMNLAVMVPAYGRLAHDIAAAAPGDGRMAPELANMLAMARAPLLDKLNAVTREYVSRNLSETNRALRLQDISLLTVLMTLILEAIIIFRPMIKQIMNHTDEWARLLADRDRFLAEQSRDLRRSNEDLEQFAYIISHDLRGPLNNIRALSEWIADDIRGHGSPETIRNVERVRARTDRLQTMLEGLLEYSRVGRAKAVPMLTDTAALVAEIVESITIPQGFTVQAGPLPSIWVIGPPLLHVLQNLIGNALKHHDREKGVVLVSCRDLGTDVEFTVEDDGPGISPAHHEKIFELFQQLKPHETREVGGVGLAIVKKAVLANGGNIRVESDPPNRGTAFVFTWKKLPETEPVA